MSENSEKTDLEDMKIGVANKFDISSQTDDMSMLNQMLKKKNRKEILERSREYVWTTGLLYRLIKLKVDFICSGFRLIHKNEKIENYYQDLYKKLDVNKYIRNFAFEQIVTGESYPFYSWKGDEPNHISLLNPLLTRTKTILGQDIVYLQTSTDIQGLLHSKNPEERKVLNKIIPKKIINQWEKGKWAVLPEENASRYALVKAYHEKYAHSPVEPIMKDLLLLHELIDGDYSVARKIKQLITHVKIGDKNYREGKALPKKIVNGVEELFDNPNGKTLDLFTQWFVDIDFPLPDIEKIYTSDKYKEVTKRIINWSGLGIFFGDGSSYASGYLKVKPVQQEIQNYRNLIIKALDDFNRLIADKKGLTSYADKLKIPEVRFNRNTFKDEEDILQIIKFLYTYGLLSAEEVMGEFGYDIERQMSKKEFESDNYYDQMVIPFEPSQGLLDDEEGTSNETLKPKDDNNSATPRN